MTDLVEGLTPIQAFERQELERAYRALLASPDGQRVLFDILERAAVYIDPHSGADTHSTSYMLGRQSVGRMLIGQMDAIDPRLYPRLLMDRADMKAMDIAASAAQQGEEDEE